MLNTDIDKNNNHKTKLADTILFYYVCCLFSHKKMSTATVSIHSRALSNIWVRCLLRYENIRGHETCKKMKFVSCCPLSRVANFSENVTDRYKRRKAKPVKKLQKNTENSDYMEKLDRFNTFFCCHGRRSQQLTSFFHGFLFFNRPSLPLSFMISNTLYLAIKIVSYFWTLTGQLFLHRHSIKVTW